MRRELTGILNGNLMRSTDTQTRVGRACGSQKRVGWACGQQKQVGWACGPRVFYLTSAANVIPAQAGIHSYSAPAANVIPAQAGIHSYSAPAANVIPAQAGIHSYSAPAANVIPAQAGIHSYLSPAANVIPAQAGIHSYSAPAANVIPAQAGTHSYLSPVKGRGCSGHCHPPCAPPSKRHARAGFTFTEVIVASSLLILAMVPILRALTQAHLGSVVIERRSRCLTLAQTKLDDIKARSIYNWTDRTESNTSLDGAYLCTVLDVAQSGDLKKITVKVGYDLNDNSLLDADEVEITLVTLVARRW